MLDVEPKRVVMSYRILDRAGRDRGSDSERGVAVTHGGL